jgi:hypothetical protein
MTATLTLGQAAKTSGVAPERIRKAIEAGVLPARRLDGWVYQIDPSDLARVFSSQPEVVPAEPRPKLRLVARARDPVRAEPEAPTKIGRFPRRTAIGRWLEFAVQLARGAR